MGLLFLLDECVESKALVNELGAMGHRTLLVRGTLRQGVDDAAIAEHANNLRAILVTRNKKHFRKLLARRPVDNQRTLRYCSAIYVMSDDAAGAFRRIRHILGAEMDYVAELADPRVLIEVNPRRILVVV